MKRLVVMSAPLDGVNLIEASAGTGKTYTITTLFLRLLLERRLEVDRILVVTFTKAATAELRDRLRRRLSEASLAFAGAPAEGELAELVAKSRDRASDREWIERALSAFDCASVFTIHGFCQRALAEFAFESGARFDLDLVADQRALLYELACDFWARELQGATRAELCHLKERGIGLERWTRLGGLVLSFADLELVPAAKPVDAAPAVARYLRARERARALFGEARTSVERLLGDTRRLNQQSYRVARLPERMAALDALFAREDASLAGWDTFFDKLSPEALQSGTKRGECTPEHPFFESMAELSEARASASGALDTWRIALEHRFVERVRREMLEKKLELGVQSFDDLLLGLSRALQARRGADLATELRRRYRAVLVDEFQDTDPTQYGIFRRVWGKRGALFLVGDPKQAIYAFRGADIFSYLEAARDAGESTYTLNVNRRSAPSLTRAVNTLFSRARTPFVLDGIAYNPVDPAPDAHDLVTRLGKPTPALDVALLSDDVVGRDGRMNKPKDELAQSVAALVSRDLAARYEIGGTPLGPGNIAILTRTNNQAFEIQTALRELGIPSVLLGDKSVLDSEQANEIWFILRALAVPNDERALLAALATTAFGFGASELSRLREDAARLELEVDAFRRWHALWQGYGFVHAFRSMLREAKISPRLLALPDGERRLTNLTHLGEILHFAATTQHLGMAGLRRWFDDVRLDPGARDDLAPDTQQLRLESDALAVKLTTMHKSKGLEYDVVYAPYLWDGTLRRTGETLVPFHDLAASSRPRVSLVNVDSGSPERELLDREQRAENMRLAYVALTRAKHRVSVIWGGFRVAATSPLATLLHAPEPGDPRAAAQIVESLDGDGILRDLSRVAKAAGGTLELSEIPESAERYRAPPRRQIEFSSRPLTRRLDLTRRIGSFSGLIAGRDPAHITLLGRDLDEGTGSATAAIGTEDEESVPLHAFPRGAKAGDALHELFERIDFRAAEPAEVERLALEVLGRHGLDTTWAAELGKAVCRILATPLTNDGRLRLLDVAREKRLPELEFTFPVAPRDGPAISSKALAAIFAAHPSGIFERYAASVRALSFVPLAGHLRGFIDLVFEHEGKIYVLDYKSNHMGARPRDYDPERLAFAMAEHHYYLQYHLYTLAVHRYFCARRRDYAYERDFGGVFYLFLRGMAPERGPMTGVFFERPPFARIRALSALFGEKESHA